MKSSQLLKEIQETIQLYDIELLKEKLKRDDINPISKQVSTYNLKNYNEIMKRTIAEGEDEEIDDSTVNDMKNELELFFKGCSPESEYEFMKFIESICLYLTFIAKKPLHPVGIDFRDNNTVFEKETDNQTVYYCDVKEHYMNEDKEYCTCKFCVCKSV